MGIVGCLQAWCATGELEEWGCELHSYGYLQIVKSRGIDVSHEVL
jgi:hypothetical protein